MMYLEENCESRFEQKLIFHRSSHSCPGSHVSQFRLYVSLKRQLFLTSLIWMHKCGKNACIISSVDVFSTFTLRQTFPFCQVQNFKFFRFFPPRPYPYLLMYEIMDPIWILEIKMSEIRRSCSHLEKQSKVWAAKGGKKEMENLRQRKKRGYVIIRNRILV